MTKFDWIISAMECKVKEDNLTDIVILINWIYNATITVEDKSYFADTYGATSLPLPTEENFIQYVDLTKEQVVGWLESILDVPAMQMQLEANIDLQINPVSVILPLPFNN